MKFPKIEKPYEGAKFYEAFLGDVRFTGKKKSDVEEQVSKHILSVFSERSWTPILLRGERYLVIGFRDLWGWVIVTTHAEDAQAEKDALKGRGAWIGDWKSREERERAARRYMASLAEDERWILESDEEGLREFRSLRRWQERYKAFRAAYPDKSDNEIHALASDERNPTPNEEAVSV